MRRLGVALALAGALVASAAPVAHAQRGTGRRGGGGQRAGMMRGMQGTGQAGVERMRLQRQIRQAFTRAVRVQVGLSDEQMRQLAPINRKYVGERLALAREETETRMALRDELSKAKPNQDSVARLSDQLQSIPRRRLDLNDAEDKELAGIMTPVQLARYRALQERVQRQLNMMRGAMRAGEAPPLALPDSSNGGGGG